ncbi:winged helix-turn-helix domain-containing protein [Agrobacterium pusense]|uniref:winged helix-turn-helix domain-containing protein n=1 Tax=Agrobacterium pusense TaxID=648995 RepID=UPI0035A68E1F
MSTYLQIAEEILLRERRPMSARAILKLAHAMDMVPYQLYGRTQHKTLQARLSEDILYRKERSPFFRTKPGVFFLRRFLTDSNIPIEYRREMTARRRTRELLRGPALSIPLDALSYNGSSIPWWEARSALETVRDRGTFSYIDPKREHPSEALLWSFASVMRGSNVLTYRVGRYRDDRDHFALKRSIGFSSLVLEENRSLFDTLTFGIEESALSAVAIDLDIPLADSQAATEKFEYCLKYLTVTDDPRPDILAFVEIKAPSWFEPTALRLSLNDLRWMDLSRPPNNMDDFDPWSQLLLSRYFGAMHLHA